MCVGNLIYAGVESKFILIKMKCIIFMDSSVTSKAQHND